jgi:regulator of protease activity HflC (stomatin/prohibitin superfamily)
MSDQTNGHEHMVKNAVYEEKKACSLNGMFMLIANILINIAGVVGMIFSIIRLDNDSKDGWGIALLITTALYLFLFGPFLFAGLKIIKPKEALVLTLFGKYYGTLRHEGFYFVNPLVSASNPAAENSTGTVSGDEKIKTTLSSYMQQAAAASKKKLSLKAMTLNNERQKINDALGNPIIIGIVVIWKVANTAKAVFNVDNYVEYLSIQCDSALRSIVRQYPYDTSSDNDNEKTLRGSSIEIGLKLKHEIQARVDIAGLEIIEAGITHLSYAPEIAAAMLQRQQASAIIDARQLIVEGAVGMVEMALNKLSENGVVSLDEERKAAMVSNLMVVLCGNKDAQPVVNSGSLY